MLFLQKRMSHILNLSNLLVMGVFIFNEPFIISILKNKLQVKYTMSKNLLLPILNHMLFLKCTSELLGLEYLEIIMVSTFITFSK